MTDKLDKQWKILQKNEDPFYVCTWKGLQNILSEKIKVQNTGVLCCLPFGDGRGGNQQYINNCLHLHKTGP